MALKAQILAQVLAMAVGGFAPVARAELAGPPKVAPAVPAKAAPKKAARPKEMCVSAEEAEAFRLRHLQSRLMVAGLSCNQKEAYDAFVTSHRPTLGKYGPALIGYYNRAGGPAALNRYVTALANAAASIRSDDPEAFCTHTWNVFWELEQDPALLMTLAATNPVPAISQPAPCAVPVERPQVSEAPREAVVPVAASKKQIAAPLKDAAIQ